MLTIDVIGAVALTAIAFIVAGTLVLSSRATATTQKRVGAALLAWFVLVTTLAALGLFTAAGAGTRGVGAAVALAITTGIVSFYCLPGFRSLVSNAPLHMMIVVHSGRLLAIMFLLLYAAGRLPATFAQIAGWGDITTAVLALPVAYAVHRRVAGWRAMALAWNTFGLLDLMVAPTLGIGSAADSPLRFIFETPDTSLLAALPWFLVPGFMVPLYILIHLAVFHRLTREKQ